jgi:hypothetical protein
MAVAILAIGVFWGAILVFALSLARAAAKPAPRPAREKPFLVALDDVDFDWPEHLR